MKRIRDRVTVLDKVYHQVHGSNPEAIECKFSCDLETTEQLYKRHLQVTEEWQSLDCGWLKDKVGMLVIHNSEGRFLTVNPTTEQQNAVSKKVVEVAYSSRVDQGCWLVPPGQSMRGCPSRADDLMLRSQSGNIEITLYLLPK